MTKLCGRMACFGACGMSWFVLLAVGCNDSQNANAPDDGGGTADAQVVAYCATAVPGTLDLIDDMEDGDNAIARRAGRSGYWYTYHDETSGVLDPEQGAAVVMEPISGGRCGSSAKAMRVTGSGFMNWGSGFGFDLKYDLAAATRVLYDGSATHGVTFWARVGDPSIATVRLDVNDAWSDPVGGHCDVTIPLGPTSCYDAYGHDVHLTTTWQRYTFDWGELSQRMFGITRPALDSANLTQIHFDMPPSAPVFDIWIDDISFF